MQVAIFIALLALELRVGRYYGKEDSPHPRLRFPEFSDAWGEVRLGDENIAEIYQPKTLSERELANEGFVVYGANGIIGHYKDYNHKREQVIITCRGSTCGEVTFTEPFSWITGNAMVINADNSSQIRKKFLYQLMLATDLSYLVSGSGQPQITSNIKSHKITIPKLPEQKKIAGFLGAVDRRIAALEARHAALASYKKGLMQQLFTQRLRFTKPNNTLPQLGKTSGGCCGNLSAGDNFTATLSQRVLLYMERMG